MAGREMRKIPKRIRSEYCPPPPASPPPRKKVVLLARCFSLFPLALPSLPCGELFGKMFERKKEGTDCAEKEK